MSKDHYLVTINVKQVTYTHPGTPNQRREVEDATHLGQTGETLEGVVEAAKAHLEVILETNKMDREDSAK